MYTIINSLKNIYRYLGKYKAFAVLFIIVILAAAICVNIYLRMDKITDNILHEYASVVRFDSPIRSAADQQKPRMTKNEYLQYKNNEYISDIRFFRYIFYAGNTTCEIKKSLIFNGKKQSWGGSGQPFIIIGYNTSLLNLETYEFKLEQGRMFEKDDEAVIDKNRLYPDGKEFLGKEGWNDLELGDKVVLYTDAGLYKEYTIVGILEQDPENTREDYYYALYTTLEGAECFDSIAKPNRYAIAEYLTKHLPCSDMFLNTGYDTLIYLESPEYFTPLSNMLFSDGIRIKTLFPNANALLNLTNSMRMICVVFMVIAGLLIVCVTIVSTNILLNTRKYEIAVLRSIGMKKSRLILGYLIENLAFIWGITLIALIAAQFIAPLFSGSVTGEMSALVSPEMLANLTSVTNIGFVLENVGIVFIGTTAVVILSLVMTIVNIVRFEPLKIFSKQY